MAQVNRIEELANLSAGDFIRQQYVRQISANENGIISTLKTAGVVLNGGMERDTDLDGKPDNWTCYSASSAVVFSRPSGSGASGLYAIKIDQTSSSVPTSEYSYIETEYYPAVAGRKYYIDITYKVTNSNDRVVIYAIPSADGANEGTAVTIADINGGQYANEYIRIVSDYAPVSTMKYFKIRVGIVKTSGGGNILYVDNVNILGTPPAFNKVSSLVQTTSGSTTQTAWTDVNYIDLQFPFIVNFDVSVIMQCYVYTNNSSYTANLRAKFGSDVYTNSFSTTSTAAVRHLLQSAVFKPYAKALSGSYYRTVRVYVQGYISASGGTCYVGKDAIGFIVAHTT